MKICSLSRKILLKATILKNRTIYIFHLNFYALCMCFCHNSMQSLLKYTLETLRLCSCVLYVIAFFVDLYLICCLTIKILLSYWIAMLKFYYEQYGIIFQQDEHSKSQIIQCKFNSSSVKSIAEIFSTNQNHFC